MAATPIDYAALAKQAGAISSQPAGKVDYDALAKQAGSVESQPFPSDEEYAKTPVIPQGFFSSAADSSGLSGLGHLIAHPIDTIAGIPGAIKSGVKGAIDDAHSEVDALHSGNYADAAYKGITHLPVIGPSLDKQVEQHAEGNYKGQLGTAFGTTLGLFGPSAVSEALPAIRSAIPGIIRKPFTTAVDEPMLGSNLTPRARYEVAKSQGVNLDLADATNSGLPKMLKATNQDSLLGSPTYESAKTARVSALNNAGAKIANDFSPLGREEGGYKVQQDLKDNQQLLKDRADAGYEQIQSQYAKTPIANPSTVSSVAEQIQKAQNQHLSEFPSLRPAKVGGVLDDAARYGKPSTAPPVMSGLLDESGSPLPSMHQPTLSAPNVGDAIKARSGILDMYQNNPDLVKTASDAQLQRLVGATHEAVMDSLPEDAQGTLRDAQTTFKEMKQVYDNPSSPLYHAVRNPSPSQLASGIGNPTPEAIRDVSSRITPEGRGVLQRGAFENALRESPTGQYNFGRYPQRLGAIPSPYAQELFGDKLGSLKDLSTTAQTLSKDLNPSGTAKQLQKRLELGSLLTPAAPLTALQYPLAKFINSPKVVDFMMRQEPNLLPIPRIGKIVPFPNAAPLFQRQQNR